MNAGRVRVGISRCLLGDPVRYDGGHKLNRHLAEVLARSVEWVPVCPEVEAGLGTPREPMRLSGTSSQPRLVTIATERDLTMPVNDFSSRKVEELRALGLSGYVFKARSPSCGVEKVPLYDRHGKARPIGVGLFARRFRRRFPLIPVTDESRLANPGSRKHFLALVFGYHRWQALVSGGVTRRAIARFHEAESALLKTRSRPHFLMLSRLVSRASRYRPGELAARYAKTFMEALAVPPLTTKQAHALHRARNLRIRKARPQ